METLIKKSGKMGLKRTLRFGTLLFSFVAFFAISAVADDINAKSPTLTPEEKKEAATLEDKRKENIREKYLSYVLIASGVVLVIAISLFTSRSGKKEKGSSNTATPPHHKPPHHSSHDKRYGTR